MDKTSPPLSLEVASGILIAFLVIFFAHRAKVYWDDGDGNMAVLLGFAVAFIGGMLVLAGLGTISW